MEINLWPQTKLIPVRKRKMLLKMNKNKRSPLKRTRVPLLKTLRLHLLAQKKSLRNLSLKS